MAADQWRKRLNGVSVGGCSPLEDYKMKKRKLGSLQNGLNSKSNISLKWDESKKKVIAKQEQIGISRRISKPFTDSVSGSKTVLGHLADAFSVPQEIFELENLTEVLSYEVWQTQLSEEERNYLKQFLPSSQNAEQVVEALLTGENFHFGSPFLKWGASLCSGNFHPDAVLHKERSLKADKKAYFLELQKYHNDILEYLQKLKQRWESCKDPEKEILPKIWRLRRDVEKRISSNAYESRPHDLEQDVTATSESCSWVADEKACSSDNQNSSVMKGGELHKRNYDKGFKKNKSTNSLIASENVLNVGTKLKKGYKLNKHNIHHNDGAQYMSYVKISRKQHELVKSMKQSGKSIQCRSMNRVLGNLESLHVQPYEVFLEEEQKKKLHEHWLKLATEDLPAFFVNWKERKKQLWEVTLSLRQEMMDKLECQIEDEEKENSGIQDEEEENSGIQDEEEENSGGVQDEEEENSGGVQDEEEENSGVQDEEEENSGVQDETRENPESPPQDKKEIVATNHESNIEENVDGAQGSPWNQSPEQIACHSESHELNHVDHESNIKDDGDSDPGSPWNQSPEPVIYPSGSHELNHISVDPEKDHVAHNSDNSSSDVRGNSEQMNTADDAVNREVPLSTGGDVWQAISRPHSFYDSTASHEFTTSGLPLMNPQHNQDQRTRLIDLESDLHQEDMSKDLLHRQPDDGALSSYQNHGRNELLQSLFKGREMLSYHQEQKQTGLHFQPPDNSMMADDGQFPGHFQEHLETSLPLEQGQKRMNEFFMQQNMSQNIFSDRGRYLIPRQENLQLGNMHNWNVNPVHISEPLESRLNGGELLSQNWFSGEHQVRGGWTNSGGVSIQSPSVGNGSNADQSLYSVLPSCSQLRSVNPYDSVGANEQFISSRNYGLMAGGVPGMSNALPNPAHPLDYLGGRDSVMPDEMGWMNMPNQNPTLHDPMGKPYLRSWNH
ncbi:nuclear factor kappa-B-binding protein [Citrus sinensis]|uniref:uncharacterized protein LOC102625405 isoform X1 n=1 Tax=Citrus sinensis TaxID=2711 RepID=UPI00219AB7EF|nr:uncharacterized protein LOC102625405 isoform X1 [Citrus sinensis]XP_006468903.2 uncharacterized protein LOC102625405 isoform X1 [Citrus sinensis]KAH9743133.1 nuclear factor kappa-B-binding protein [Citrus sinensis]